MNTNRLHRVTLKKGDTTAQVTVRADRDATADEIVAKARAQQSFSRRWTATTIELLRISDKTIQRTTSLA